ncbi:MAG TPA: hypothetical protein VER17_15875, partial [Tepidisphaeraceae bacterium]|nr:hypothetical protein [Tepidisphaeraceae bacterium]
PASNSAGEGSEDASPAMEPAAGSNGDAHAAEPRDDRTPEAEPREQQITALVEQVAEKAEQLKEAWTEFNAAATDEAGDAGDAGDTNADAEPREDTSRTNAATPAGISPGTQQRSNAEPLHP